MTMNLFSRAVCWYRHLYKNLHLIYLILVAPFAIVLCFLVPPLQGADEWAHFLRSAQISQGGIVGSHSRAFVPKSVVEFIKHPANSPVFYLANSPMDYSEGSRLGLNDLSWHSEKTRTGSPFAAYPPTSYLPAALGLVFSHIAKFNLVNSFYLGRFFTAFFALALSALAIRFLTGGKWLAFFVLSLPTTIYYFGSYAQDAMLIAYTALSIALIKIWQANGFTTKLGRYSLIAAALLMSVVLASRPPYYPLALLLPILIYSATRCRVMSAKVLALILSLPLMWMIISGITHNIVYPHFQGVNETEQAKWVLHHPLHFLEVLWRSPIVWPSVGGMVGSSFLHLPNVFQILLLLIFILFVLIENLVHVNPLSWLVRLFIFFLMFSSLVLFLVFAYIYWTPLGSPSAVPLVGRYLEPILLFSIFIMGRKLQSTEDAIYWLPLMAAVFGIVSIFIINIAGVLVVMQGYWYIR